MPSGGGWPATQAASALSMTLSAQMGSVLLVRAERVVNEAKWEIPANG